MAVSVVLSWKWAHIQIKPLNAVWFTLSIGARVRPCVKPWRTGSLSGSLAWRMNAIQPCSIFLNFSAPNSSISALLSFRYFSLGLAALAVVASVMIFAHALCSGALRAALTSSRLSRFQAALLDDAAIYSGKSQQTSLIVFLLNPTAFPHTDKPPAIAAVCQDYQHTVPPILAGFG